MNSETILAAKLKRLYLYKGIFSLSLGVLALALPIITLVTLIIFFSIKVLGLAFFALKIAFVAKRNHQPYGLYLAESFVGLVAGIGALAFPEVAMWVVVSVIIVWTIIRGLNKIISAIFFEENFSNVFWLSLSGFLYLLFALVLIFSNLEIGVGLLVFCLGILSIFNGISYLIISFNVKKSFKIVKISNPINK